MRIQTAHPQWRLSSLDNQQVLVEVFIHVDPNGLIPAWISNMVIINSLYKTLKKMREIIASGRYQNTTISFIKQS